MRKRFITILIAFLSVLMLAGCRSSKPDLEVMPHDDNTITITADKAGISGVGGAGITVADGQQLVIDSALSKGSIQLKLFLDNEPAGVDASLDMCCRRLPETSRSVRSNLPPLKFDAVQ